MRRIVIVIGLALGACGTPQEKVQTGQTQQTDSVAPTARIPDTMPMPLDSTNASADTAMPKGMSGMNNGGKSMAGMQHAGARRGNGQMPGQMNHSMMNMDMSAARSGQPANSQRGGMQMSMPPGQTMEHAPSSAMTRATQKVDELVKRLLQDSLVRARIERDSTLKRLAKSAANVNESMKHE